MSSAPVTARTDFPTGYTDHHTYRELESALQAVAREHPSIAQLRKIGSTRQGRSLYVLKVSDNVETDEAEPEVYVDAGIHADEHISTELALELVHWLVDGYGTDARTSSIVNATEIWIAPMVNPDGAMFDISGGAFHEWRKNRQPIAGSTQIGVDPNRSFGYKWGCCRGSSPDPASAMYRGKKAWSTRESIAIRDFVKSRVIDGAQQIRLALTLHSHGEFVMYPFGWTPQQPTPMTSDDLATFQSLADGMAARNDYRALQAGSLYLSNGTFMDWAYARQHVFALTMELGPPASVDDGWYLPDAQRRQEIDRNQDAVLWFLEQAQSMS